MSRKKTDPNSSTDSTFTEKARKRQSRNPLKRGTSEKNMQQIPSPSESTSELPSSSVARPPTSFDPHPVRPATSSNPQIPPIPQMPASQMNEPTEQNGEPTRPSADNELLNIPNGTGPRHEGLANEPSTPSDPSYKLPQVS